MELYRIGVKFFAEQDADMPLVEFIPIFHRWIQAGTLGELLIDVADYGHVWAGPGIVLVAHEGNYAVDETGGRRGLVYYCKHAFGGTLSERLRVVCVKALTACRLLEEGPETRGRLRFRGDEVEIFSNDRLAAPNTEETYAAIEPALHDLCRRLYPEGSCSLLRRSDPKERFAVTVKGPPPVTVDTLLQQVGNEGARLDAGRDRNGTPGKPTIA